MESTPGKPVHHRKDWVVTADAAGASAASQPGGAHLPGPASATGVPAPANAFSVLMGGHGATSPDDPAAAGEAAPTGAPGAHAQAGTMHHGGSFANYMNLKVTKLREQYEASTLQTAQASDLFKGVTIFVNGLTKPSKDELRVLMLQHGGRFEHYERPEAKITHYICSNLPDTKVKQQAKKMNPIPVVRPEWIVASLQAGHLLPIKDFSLLPDAAGDPSKQTRLKAFAQHAVQLPAATDLYPQLLQPPPQPPAPAPPMAAAAASFPGPAALMPPPQQQHLQRQSMPAQTPAPAPAAPPAQQPPLPPQRLAGVAAAAAASPPRSPPTRPPGPGPGEGSDATAAAAAAAAAAASMREAQALCERLRQECDVLRGPPNTSHENPNFMDEFYRSSRLHFIGTWKARIETLMADTAGQGPQPLQPAKGSIVDLFNAAANAAAPHPRPPPPSERAIIHIDMDCFFASVAEARHPVLKGKPLVVSHSASSVGRGEVSAGNYAARAFGIHAGQGIGEAKRQCPHLLVVPYMFEEYQAVSEQVYHILVRRSACVQPISCDEAFMDVTGLGDPEEVAARLRAEIEAATGCTASAGIGPNMLLARLATRRAKPNGQHRVPGDAPSVLRFLGDLPVDALPGVGWSMKNKLWEEFGISRVREVWSASKERLKLKLGEKIGATLWAHAHGRDDRQVQPPRARKSVGAEVNWGVRFSEVKEVHAFLKDLSEEVSKRMLAAGVKGKCVTLKVMQRQEGAPAPYKFLGHGACDSHSRSVTLGASTDQPDDVLRVCWELFQALKLPPADVRGVGISISKLNNDAVHAAARPTVGAPSKLPAPSPSAYDRVKEASKWGGSLHLLSAGQDPDALRAQQQQQQQQKPSAGGAGARSAAAAGPPPPHAPTLPPGVRRGQEAGAGGAAAAAGGSRPAGCRVGLWGHDEEQEGDEEQREVDGDGEEAWDEEEEEEGHAWEQGRDGGWRDEPMLGLEEEGDEEEQEEVPAAAARATARKQLAFGAAAAAGGGGGGTAAAPAAGTRQQRQQQQQHVVTMSQVDPEVLAALPEDVRREVLASVAGGAAAAAGGRESGLGKRRGRPEEVAGGGKPSASGAAAAPTTATTSSAGGGAASLRLHAPPPGAPRAAPAASGGAASTVSASAAAAAKPLFSFPGMSKGAGKRAAGAAATAAPPAAPASKGAKGAKRGGKAKAPLAGGGAAGLRGPQERAMPPPPRPRPQAGDPYRHVTISQVDPEVLAALPEDVRREVLASVAGGAAAAAGGKEGGLGKRRGRPEEGAAAARVERERQAAELEGEKRRRVAYVAEPLPEVLSGFARMVDALMGRAGAEEAQGQEEAHARLMLGLEHLAQCLTRQSAWDLEAQARALGTLRALGRRWGARFARYAGALEGALQRHAAERYGVRLRPAGTLLRGEAP